MPDEIKINDISEKILQDCLEHLKHYIDAHESIDMDKLTTVFNIDRFISDLDIDDILKFSYKGYRAIPKDVNKGGNITLILRKENKR
jgi:hypothetical protein